MRFSLSHLLLAFAAFFLTVAIAASVVYSGYHVNYRWAAAHHDVTWLERTIERILANDRNGVLSDDAIKAWLGGQSLPAVTMNNDLVADPWGNAYRFRRFADPDRAGGKPFGVYSVGRDGLSSSQGEDDDDFSSWDDTNYRHRQNELAIGRRSRVALLAVYFSPLTFVVLLGSRWLWSKLRP